MPASLLLYHTNDGVWLVGVGRRIDSWRQGKIKPIALLCNDRTLPESVPLMSS